MPSSAQALREAVRQSLREAGELRVQMERAHRKAREAVARSPYGRMTRAPRDPRDPARGSLGRALRQRRLGHATEKEWEAKSAPAAPGAVCIGGGGGTARCLR